MEQILSGSAEEFDIELKELSLSRNKTTQILVLGKTVLERLKELGFKVSEEKYCVDHVAATVYKGWQAGGTNLGVTFSFQTRVPFANRQDIPPLFINEYRDITELLKSKGAKVFAIVKKDEEDGPSYISEADIVLAEEGELSSFLNTTSVLREELPDEDKRQESDTRRKY